ncbi:MAG: hypothetical protein C4K60_14900 [Ideonella sp. MAG2]|nr:MAG: hypothetical protein C4K60_14900 [Ideonella sp. MAG2]
MVAKLGKSRYRETCNPSRATCRPNHLWTGDSFRIIANAKYRRQQRIKAPHRNRSPGIEHIELKQRAAIRKLPGPESLTMLLTHGKQVSATPKLRFRGVWGEVHFSNGDLHLLLKLPVAHKVRPVRSGRKTRVRGCLPHQLHQLWLDVSPKRPYSHAPTRIALELERTANSVRPYSQNILTELQ